ncbi:unnamed protein product, partial [Urochloa humidicola]
MGKLFLVLCLSLFLPHAAFSADAGGRCVRQCGSTLAPYPFGFSGDCPILLVCNATASAALLPRSTAAASYPIKSFNTTTSTFVVSVPPSCNRTVGEVHNALSGNGAGYGVSYRTGIFLSGNCSRRGAGSPGAPAAEASFNCAVSSQFLTQILRRPECGGGLDSSWTCVASTRNVPNTSTAPRGQFMDWNDVRDAGCREAVTAALYADTAAGAPSVEFGVAEMGWWLDGTCAAAGGVGVGKCAANATCYDVETPDGAWGHRCACRDGMPGDGFAAGEGCHYALGRVSGKVRHAVGVAVVSASAGIVVLIIASSAYVVHKRKRRKNSKVTTKAYKKQAPGDARLFRGRPVDDDLEEEVTGPQRFSYDELAAATGNFSDDRGLGSGGFGSVYRGFLTDGNRDVAVKRVSKASRQGWKEFVSEGAARTMDQPVEITDFTLKPPGSIPRTVPRCQPIEALPVSRRVREELAVDNGDQTEVLLAYVYKRRRP